MNENYEIHFNEEWKYIVKERLDECLKREKSQFELFKHKLMSNKIFKLLKFSFDFKLYQSFYPSVFEFYLSEDKEHVLFFGYLDKFHGGRLGYIHGGASFNLTFICSSILLQGKIGEKWILQSQNVNYKKKLKINSYVITESNIVYRDQYKIKIKSNLIDIDEDVCIESDFCYSLKPISF